MRNHCSARNRRLQVIGGFAAATLAACGGGGGGDTGQNNGGGGTPPPPQLPTETSSSQSAYVVPTTAGWNVVPLLTVGDMPTGSTYAMVGKPDGLGALAGKASSTGEIQEPERYLTILMSHETPAA